MKPNPFRIQTESKPNRFTALIASFERNDDFLTKYHFFSRFGRAREA